MTQQVSFISRKHIMYTRHSYHLTYIELVFEAHIFYKFSHYENYVHLIPS